MKNIIVIIAAVCISVSFASQEVIAAEKDKNGPIIPTRKGTEKRKATPALSQKLFKKLSEIQALLDPPVDEKDGKPKKNAKIPTAKLNEALRKGMELEQSDKFNFYEKAQIQNLLAFIFYLKEDLDGAVRYYLKLIKLPDVPDGLYFQTLRTIAQINLAKEDYNASLKYSKKYLRDSEQRDPEILALIGIAYYLLEDTNQAFTYVKEAVDSKIKVGTKPKEQWLAILRAVYVDRKDDKNATKTLKLMVSYYPRVTYLIALSGVYGIEDKEQRQLAVMEMLYDGDHLEKETHYRNLTGLMLNLGISFKAADILKELFEQEKMEATEKNLLLYSQALYQAHRIQESIKPLRQAAKKSKTGDLYLRLAYSYSGLEDWKQVVTYSNRALKVGKLKNREKAVILLGTAHFNNNNLETALKSFESIRDSDNESNLKLARNWMEYITEELGRREILERIRSEVEYNENTTLEQLKQVIN